jgi:ADP-heptose:LPS heptosyltransferase
MCVRQAIPEEELWLAWHRTLSLRGTNVGAPIDAEAIRRIIVLRANGLGDFLFATPALRAVAKSFRRAEITYVCQPWLRSFLLGRYPYLHRILSVPPYPGLRDDGADPGEGEHQRSDFFRRRQAEHFDLAIQMHGGGAQSNPFVRQLGARLTVGLTGKGVTPLDINVTYQFYQNEILRYLELVKAIGVAVDGLEMDAPELADDGERLRQVWPDLPAGELVVVHVGASDPRRRWPIERFAAVADYVQRSFGLPVAATGSANDRPLVAALAATVNSPLVNLAGRLDLGAVLALFRQARLVVSNDTGLSNLAVALGAPCVVVYWCGNVITAGPFYRTNFRPVLSWTVDCPSCGRRDCRCPVSFVAGASLAEVLDHVDDLLRHAKPPTEASRPVTILNDNNARRERVL